MTDQEKDTLYSVLMQLIDGGETLTKLEHRDLISQLTAARCDMTADEILSATENNRKLRIKRGTTAQNDEYTGLSGELLMDVDTNTLRIHDGETPGGHVVAGGGATLPENMDYVVESWMADDGSSWYRKYASGWIEQGGTTTNSDIEFPVPFTSNAYSLVATAVALYAAGGTISICYHNKQSTGIYIQVRWNGGAADNSEFMWIARGM